MSKNKTNLRRLMICSQLLVCAVLAIASARSSALMLNAGDIVTAGAGRFLHVNPLTGDITTISSGSFFAREIAIEPGGTILATGSSRLIRIDPSDGSQADVATLTLYGGLALDSLSNIYVAGSTTAIPGISIGDPGIFSIDPVSGTISTVLLNPLLLAAEAMAFDSSGDLLIAIDTSSMLPNGAILRVDMDSLLVTVLVTPGDEHPYDIGSPHAIAVDPLDRIFYPHNGRPALMRLDPGSTEPTVVAIPSSCPPDVCMTYLGLALEASGMVLAAVGRHDTLTGGLARIDPATGTVVFLGDPTEWHLFGNELQAVAVVPTPDPSSTTLTGVSIVLVIALGCRFRKI